MKLSRNKFLLALCALFVGCKDEEPIRRPFRIRAALLHMVLQHLEDRPVQKANRNFTALVELLSENDSYALAAETSVIKWARLKKVYMDLMTIHEIVKFLWDNREIILKILLDILPLFIGDERVIRISSS